MKRKYDGSAVQRRHPGQAPPRPQAWRLEEERGALPGCDCFSCLEIRREVQAELGPKIRRARNRPHRPEPRIIPRSSYQPINWNWNPNDPGLNLAEAMRQVAEGMRAAIDQGWNIIREGNTKRTEANQRAEDLLASLLTPEQQEAWRTGPSCTVTVPSGNRYRLHANSTFRLGENGEPIASYCLISQRAGLPVADLVASRLLLLQANEELFLRLANGNDLRWDSGNVTWTAGPFVWNHG